MSKTKNIFTKYGIILSVVLMALLLSMPLVFKSNAGALSSAYLYLSRMKTNLTGADAANNVEMVLAFSTGQGISTKGNITIVFPDDDDGNWCRTAGALTVTGVTAANPDQGDWSIDAALPGDTTLEATCSKGSGGSSADTITITNVGALTAGTVYGVKLANGAGSTGVLGTDDTAGVHNVTVEARNGTVADSSTFGIYLVSNDQVVVTATVSSAPSVSCTISTNAIDLGSMYPGGAFTTGQHTISTQTTSSANGYYWAVYGKGDGSTDAGLWKSTATTYLIPSTGSTTVDLRGVGTQGFGMTASDPDAGESATVATTFADTTLGVFGALDRGVAGAKLLLSQQGAQASQETSTITYGAKAGPLAQAGTYQETVTFVCGGYY